MVDGGGRTRDPRRTGEGRISRAQIIEGPACGGVEVLGRMAAPPIEGIEGRAVVLGRAQESDSSELASDKASPRRSRAPGKMISVGGRWGDDVVILILAGGGEERHGER